MPICQQYDVLSGGAGDQMANCAWIYYRGERIAAGEILRSRLLKRPASAIDYRLLTAYAHIKKKEYDQAREMISALEKERLGKSKKVLLQEISAELYESIGRKDTAAFLYKQIVGDQPDAARAHWGLARHYLSKGENTKAIVHLIQVAKSWPKHQASRFNLGVLYLSQDNLGQAGKWLAESYQLNRADSGVLEQLGALFEKKGNLADALKYWQKALDINKNSSLAKRKLKRYYGKLIDRAIEEKKYKKALVYLENSFRVGTKSRKKPTSSGPNLQASRQV